MSQFTDQSFLSSNGKTMIHVRRCTPDTPPVGIVQIAHGVAEHVERYDAFAGFLAAHGFLVVANDHLGHGQSIVNDDDLGFFDETDGWEKVVEDMRKLHAQTSGEFPGLPYFLFGHSMGSFLTRTYIIQDSTGLAGAVICGTGQQIPPVVRSGKLLGKAVRRRGMRHKSEFLNNVAFGSYNKSYSEVRTPYDWLSRDPDVVDKYIADPLCGFIPSVELFIDMMEGIEFIGSAKNIQRMRKDLPIFLISGDKDPVGENGKGVERVFSAFRKAGMTDVTKKLYPDCRHELLNELNREEVMKDILDWLMSKMPMKGN